MILNFESCYKRDISGRLLGDYVVQIKFMVALYE